MAYATSTQVKAYLGLTTSTDDTLIGTLLSAAQTMIERATGRVFEASDTTRYFYLDDLDRYSGVLWFTGDLCTLTSVTNGDGTSVTVSDVQTLPVNSTPWYGLRINPAVGTFTSGHTTAERIAITGKWSYSASAPADIVQATIRMTAFLYRARENGGDTDRTVFAGNATLSPQALPVDVQAVVRAYAMAVTS
jgi:uncharacterized phiE125 gp8 family phage protein